MHHWGNAVVLRDLVVKVKTVRNYCSDYFDLLGKAQLKILNKLNIL